MHKYPIHINLWPKAAFFAHLDRSNNSTLCRIEKVLRKKFSFYVEKLDGVSRYQDSN